MLQPAHLSGVLRNVSLIPATVVRPVVRETRSLNIPVPEPPHRTGGPVTFRKKNPLGLDSTGGS